MNIGPIIVSILALGFGNGQDIGSFLVLVQSLIP
jgi:hypothetical protein